MVKQHIYVVLVASLALIREIASQYFNVLQRILYTFNANSYADIYIREGFQSFQREGSAFAVVIKDRGDTCLRDGTHGHITINIVGLAFFDDSIGTPVVPLVTKATQRSTSI